MDVNTHGWNRRNSLLTLRRSAGALSLALFLQLVGRGLGAQVPPAPTLNSPGSTTSPGTTITTLTPTMSWNASSGANNYGLYVFDVASSTPVYVSDSVGNVTSFHLPPGCLLSGHTYRWNMRASNSAGYSDYSSTLYFQVQLAGTPAPPTLKSPGSTTSPGTAVTDLTPTMS